jgi:Ser/Thr protein kinase RdoA (MazF antagonist)
VAADRLGALTREALAAALGVAREQKLPVDDPRVLPNRGNLLVRFGPAPVLARVATLTAWMRRDPLAWLAREVAVARHAARRGAPVVAPASIVDPGPYWRDGFALSLWTYTPFSAQRPDAAAVGAALAQLHTSLADYPGTLPVMVPVHEQIDDGLAVLAREHILGTEQVVALRSCHEEVLAELDGVGSAAVLHGDAHSGNLLRGEHGWRWIDMEETCVGPREWDLAVMISAFAGEKASAGQGVDAETALASYAATSGTPLVTPEELTPFLRARELEAAVWTLGMAHHHPARYRDGARTLLTTILKSRKNRR